MEDAATREMAVEMGLEVGETITLVTNDWEGIAGTLGDRGKIQGFARAQGQVFANVLMQGETVPFPFLRSEIERP
ncbi:hypothetical protein ABZ092_35970 [Streptomyces bobili]|uniref:hypothetical protein n=1 Tax=Streptomyces bobili TaxID=67280 RepID=UPI0033BB6A79